jgi:hypothetical protein
MIIHFYGIFHFFKVGNKEIAEYPTVDEISCYGGVIMPINSIYSLLVEKSGHMSVNMYSNILMAMVVN